MPDKAPDRVTVQPIDVRPVQNTGNGTYQQSTITIILLAITTAGTLGSAWISSGNRDRISDVHSIVNSQRTEMSNEIIGLKETIKNMNTLIVNRTVDPQIKKSQ